MLQAEYNRFLEKKNAEKPQVYNKQKSNNAMAMSPQVSSFHCFWHLLHCLRSPSCPAVDEQLAQAPESYYGNERSPEGFGPTAKAVSRGPTPPMTRQVSSLPPMTFMPSPSCSPWMTARQRSKSSASTTRSCSSRPNPQRTENARNGSRSWLSPGKC